MLTTVALLVLTQWSYQDLIGDPVPAPGPIEAWKPARPDAHPLHGTPDPPPESRSPAHPSPPPPVPASTDAAEAGDPAAVPPKGPPAVPPPPLLSGGAATRGEVAPPVRSTPQAAGPQGWTPPAPPTTWQQADASGQVWTHADRDHLARWVAERNYFMTLGLPPAPPQPPQYVPFGAAPVYYQMPAYSCGPGGCGFR
jgi:hypothetical protein